MSSRFPEDYSQKAYGKDFERWWGNYPRKDAKPAAYKAWRVVCDAVTPVYYTYYYNFLEQIAEGHRAWRESVGWKRNNGENIPLGAVWLAGEWWKEMPDDYQI